MKKSKHFRKDVILARVIAAVLLIVLIVLLVFAVSLLSKSSEQDKDSQNTQNTEQDKVPGNQVTEEQDTEETEDTQDDTSETEDVEPVPETICWVKTTANLRLREAPNTSCATLERIPEGTQIGVLEDLNGWYKVIYNGKEGYVSKTYVELVETE